MNDRNTLSDHDHLQTVVICNCHGVKGGPYLSGGGAQVRGHKILPHFDEAG